MSARPTFIAFTGVDSVDLISGMKSLSKHFPIEWGILVDDAKEEEILFADPDVRSAMLTAGGMRFAAHVCGEQARLIANEPASATVDLSGFQRMQVNHAFTGSSAGQIENTIVYGRAQAVRSMLQTLKEFPGDARLDWLYDTSFGTGKAPATWPALPIGGAFCGYSGGINAGNVGAVLDAINAPDGAQFWIDMESGVREDGKFSLAKCEAVCRAVFG